MNCIHYLRIISPQAVRKKITFHNIILEFTVYIDNSETSRNIMEISVSSRYPNNPDTPTLPPVGGELQIHTIFSKAKKRSIQHFYPHPSFLIDI